MKMTLADNGATAQNFGSYIQRCNKSQCGIPYTVPVQLLSDINLYVQLGTQKPSSLDLRIVYSQASGTPDSPLTGFDYVVGKDPNSLWYAVIALGGITVAPSQNFFVITAQFTFPDDSVKRYFSQEYEINACDNLLKLEPFCAPSDSTVFSFDYTDIYYGLSIDVSTLGNAALTYTPRYFLRRAKVINMAPKVTFKSSRLRNFKTETVKQYQFTGERVPDWYKDALASIFIRGEVLINDQKYLVDELQFESSDEMNDESWNPKVRLKEDKFFYFGCNPCAGQGGSGGGVTGCVGVTIDPITLPNATVGVPYNATITLSGTGPFNTSDNINPGWMNVTYVGNTIVLTGTPTVATSHTPISFLITNCEGANQITFSQTINVLDYECKMYSFQVYGSDTDSWHVEGRLCNNMVFSYDGLGVDGPPGDVCAKVGTVISTGNIIVTEGIGC